MKLKEYIETLQEFVKQNPQALDYKVIYAKDDEGNGYQEIHYSPSVGHTEDEYHIEDFLTVEYIDEMIEEGDCEKDDYPLNSVCVN